MLRRLTLLAVTGVSLTSLAQTPAPPALLPETVRTPTTPMTPAGVGTPVGATVPVAKAPAPITRFEKDLRTLPAETSQAVQTSRTVSAWIARMQQPDGRFLTGLNPTLARPLDGVSDPAQAFATRAVVQTAVFTGEEKLAATAGQALLALLTHTKSDPADATCKVPSLTAEKCPAAFAALLALAIYEYPSADAKLLGEAEALCCYLRKQLREDGSITIAAEAIKADPTMAVMTPGLCFQALAASNRVKPEAWKLQACERGLTYYRKALATQPNVLMYATLLPAAVDCAMRNKSEPAAACVFEFADAICASQYSTGDAPSLRWVGGYRTSGNEPSALSAECSRGLTAALRYAASVPDTTRYVKYRTSVVGSLAFVRSLQMADETCQHFEKSFRTRFLLGGICTSPIDGNLRIDHAAMFTIAQLAFLESGAEKGE